MLNELDHWIESQWQENPAIKNYSTFLAKNGCENHGNGYAAMKKTGLKEMYIVRYADDFRVLCRTKGQAEKVRIAVTQWLKERLRLEVSPEKIKVVNAKRKYSEFLGFKVKVQKKGSKYTVKTRMCDKAITTQKQKLTKQIKRIAKPKDSKIELDIRLYNSMVMGVQNYYMVATEINSGCRTLQRAVMTTMTSRLNRNRISRKGRSLTLVEKKLYGKSAMLRYSKGTDEPIYPIGYVKHKNPMAKRRNICCYTQEGRAGLHDKLGSKWAMRCDRQVIYDLE